MHVISRLSTRIYNSCIQIANFFSSKKNIGDYIQVTEAEKKKYVLPTERDFLILGKCKQLEKLNLSRKDKEMVELIKTQLEDDWRKPLIVKLDELLNKYGHLGHNLKQIK